MLFVITHWKALQCPQSGRLLAFADVLHGNDFDGLPWKGWSRQPSDERSTAAWPLQAENRTACLLTRVGHALGNRKLFSGTQLRTAPATLPWPSTSGRAFYCATGSWEVGSCITKCAASHAIHDEVSKEPGGRPCLRHVQRLRTSTMGA